MYEIIPSNLSDVTGLNILNYTDISPKIQISVQANLERNYTFSIFAWVKEKLWINQTSEEALIQIKSRPQPKNTIKFPPSLVEGPPEK